MPPREEPPNTRGLAGRYLLALAIAAVVLPVMVLALNAPIWMGLAAAGLVFVGAALFGAVQKPPEKLERVDPKRVAKGQAGVIAAVMAEAKPALARIDVVIAGSPKNNIRDALVSISEAGAKIIAEVEAEPAKLAPVQRLLTYYLPRAAEMGDAYKDLRAREARAPERMQAIEDVLAKIQEACAHFEKALVDEDMRALDAEIGLLKDALKEDLGR